MKKVLILGVNGFIGHHLSKRILETTDWDVYGMDMQNDRLGDLINHPRMHFFEGDITINKEWVEYHIRKCDVILPLVAIATPATYVQQPLKVFELDFEANLPIVRSAVKYKKHLVFPSTSEVYGMCEDGEFDPAKSNFNKVWKADKAMLASAKAHHTEPHIIVGIWAPGVDRYRQYLPQPIYDAASPALRAQMDRLAGGPIVSDAYLRWMTDDLKPWVDAHLRTKTGPADTAIAGSSMGGLISCYAFMARPDVFGQAACVSSHWPSVDPREVGPTNPELQALLTGWFRQSLGAPGQRRLWMDHGTATLDAFYAPYQSVVDAQVAAKGWQKGRDFESRVYEGAEHEENAWAARLPEIFNWLFADKKKASR